MYPSYRVAFMYCNNNDRIVTLYIYSDENREPEIYDFDPDGPIVPFYSDVCSLDLRRNIGNGNLYDILWAYPDRVSLENLSCIFPNCTLIKIDHIGFSDLSNLSYFRHLKKLVLNTYDMDNLNGIEFLGSLNKLVLYSYDSQDDLPSEKILDLTQLSSLKLRKLVLKLNMRVFGTLVLPNLKLLKMQVSQYDLLASLCIPDKCKIRLNKDVDEAPDNILEIAKRSVPNAIIELR
jgi:hypothetical protein